MKNFVENPVTGKLVEQKTLARYQKRGNQLLRQFASTKAINPHDPHHFLPFVDKFNAEEFCDWLIERKTNGEISKSVWRQYQASACSLLHGLINEQHPGVMQIHLDRLKTESCAGALKKGTKTSANKQKNLSSKEQAALEAYLQSEINGERPQVLKYAKPLYHFIHGNVSSGLRPAEYAFARLNGKTLVVRNCKFSDGRSHGEKRTVHLDDLPDDVIESIGKTIQFFQDTFWREWQETCTALAANYFRQQNPLMDDFDDDHIERAVSSTAADLLDLVPDHLPDWLITEAEDALDKITTIRVERAYNGLRKNMLKLTKRVFPKRVSAPIPTLYSTRHQASANLKQGGKTHIEIAALFGHKVVETAQRHYGRQKHGEKKEGLIIADPADVAVVEKFKIEKEDLAAKRKIERAERAKNDPAQTAADASSE